MAENPDRTESIFAAAVALPATAERAALLNRECANDPSLRGRIEALLRAHDRAGHLLDRPVPGGLAQTQALLPSEQPGAVIAGRYKLLEAIGEGGMGTVWVAEQTEPVRRKVALKLIKAGMDSKSVLARFEAERQALAVMDHPNIAKVLDGGLTDAGRPYFVMEYVKGVPITEYCDATRLSVPERLNLFVQVCQAVQHAHQKGIIHRDLKPSNILVAPYDDKPIPKVIDFGLAKAMHQSLTEKTLHTAHETVLGTPLYMSPEQAQLNNLDVDTRSDIYSLGVLLYELLTGTTPLEKQRFKEAAWDEIKRIIREEEPPRPSTRLSSSNTLPSLAADRQIEPVRLTKLVRGELDWIVMKSLEKDRTRRYDTATGFAADVQRYLAGEQVLAHPPSVRYRIQKFVQRYRGRVLVAGLLLAALVAGITGTTAGLIRATKAEGKATNALGQVTEEQAKTKAALSEVIEEKAKTEQALVKATEEEQKAKATDADSRKQLARQYVDHGWKLINDGNVTEALHWYIAAFAKEQDLIDKERERVHRTRIAATMEACPRPTHILFHSAPVRQAAYSPDGRKLVTLAWDTEDDKGKLEIRVWDALNGRQIGPVISPSAIADLLSSSATLSFDGSGSKIILARSRTSSEKVAGYYSVLDIWDATTGLNEGSLTGLYAAQQGYIEVEHADKTKPVWPPKLARLVDLDALERIELPPVLDSLQRAAQIRIDPTAQYCFVPPGNEGDCELWALSPLRRISRWGGGSLSGRTASGEMQFQRLDVRFAPDGSRLVAVVHNAGQAKTTNIYSIETATGRELFPPLVFPARLQGQYSANISADATRIIIDANDKGVGGLRIYDTGTGKVIATYQPQPLMSFMNTGNYYETRTPQFVIVSVPIQPKIPAGNKRRTPSTGFFELMDAATGKPIGPPIWCEDAAYSPDMSKLLTLDEQGAMKLWNVLSGKPIAALVGTKGKVSFRGPMASKFSPSSRFVSILTDESIRIWDTQTGQPTSGSLEHRGKIIASEFNPKTEQFFTLCEDGTARLWDPNPDSTAKETVTQTPVGILETNAAGEHVAIRSARYGAPISVWDVAAGNKFSPATSLNTEEKTLLKARDLHFAGSGQTVFASNDISGFRIWESASGRVLRHEPTRNGEQIFAARSYDGRRLVTVRYPDGEARWWDAVTGQPLGNITPGDGQPIRLGAIYLYRPNPYLVTLRYRTEPNKALEVEPTVWDPARDTPTKLPWRPALSETDLKSVFQPLPQLPISLIGRTLDPMTGPDGRSAGWRLVDDASNLELASLPVGQALAIAGGNRFVIEEVDKLSVWDSATGASISRIPLTPKVSYDFRFNREGDRVVLATIAPESFGFPNPPLRSAPHLWNLTTGRPVCPPWSQSDPILGFEWSPDGRRIATWAGPETQMWDSDTGQMTGRPISHSSSVRQVRFSPDGKSLTTVIRRSAAIPDYRRMVFEGQSSKDRSGRSVPNHLILNYPIGESGGLVFLWDVATGESIAPPMPSSVPSPSIAQTPSEIGPLFSSDGRRLFTTPTSRSVRAWMIPLDERPLAELVTTAEALSGRRFQEPGSLALLSSEEWKSALNRVPGTTASIRTPDQQMARDSERAETLYAENEWEGSLSHLNSLIAAGSSKAKHFQMRGWCRHLLGIPDDALADMNKAIELGADDREIWAHRGTIYITRNQFQLAAEDYRKMARFPEATHPPGLSRGLWWADVARILSWAGHPKEYRWACDKLHANGEPFSNLPFLALLCLPSGLDDYTPIVTVCRDELEKEKRSEEIPRLKSRLGLAHLRSKQYAEAVKVIESIDPNALPMELVYGLGANELVLAIAYHHLSDRDQAEQHLQKGLEQTVVLEKDIQSGANPAGTLLLWPSTLAREAEQLIRGEPKAVTVPPMPVEK